MLADEASKVGSHMEKIPDLSDYDWGPFPSNSLGMYGVVYQRNASLALQLCRYYYDRFVKKELTKSNVTNGAAIPTAEPFKIDLAEAVGLKLCRWPGRAQVISKKLKTDGDLIYFMDGAHTQLSMLSCVDWFKTASSEHAGGLARDRVFRALLFNVTKDDRKAQPLLEPLVECDFDACFFSPNFVRQSDNIDNVNHCIDLNTQLNRCSNLVELWADLTSKPKANKVDTINDAIDAIVQTAVARNADQVQVLVTGSILLLGNALQVVDPNTTFKPSTEEQRQVINEYEKLSSET